VNDSLPDDLRAFIARNIHSVEQLEILLFVRRRRETTHTAPAVARELHFDVRSTATRLAELDRIGLVRQTGDGYEYAAAGALDAAVRALNDAYVDRRVAVISAIYAGGRT
jgi:hypothetical protein